ncbi:DUF6509 family protein [Cohnella silvisoli]|uniref:DUF6509 family protein n=1 Tax=Cohnella silvisoli TaxID=2873699 RepID=A0ABV1KQ73_9BACL|nr:DUF6509 family protein [Cohnella silvisoli]MCD9022108.1 DUF6509 family protein [Cohnella silvisoli]
MLTIAEYSVELVKDPFKILSGKRYEFKLDLEIEEDDELYSENGIYVKVVYKVDEEQGSIVTYDLIEKSTDRYLDLDMEAEEEEALAAFCKEHCSEA